MRLVRRAAALRAVQCDQINVGAASSRTETDPGRGGIDDRGFQGALLAWVMPITLFRLTLRFAPNSFERSQHCHMPVLSVRRGRPAEPSLRED